MSETNKSYRIRTNVGDNVEEYLTISTDLVQDYDTFDVLSVSIKDSDTYRLHNANYGVVVGRVLANNGFGIPNAKISIFIATDNMADREERILYPYTSSISNDRNGVRYNLLPDNKIDDCHQTVGTFPNKRYLLDNDDLIEIFDKYYKYTTRTNNSGDYLMCGIPVGAHTLHMDLDLSDCGILSQRPRDFVYKGYTVEQFENPNMFKGGHEFDTLSQILTQDQVVHVNPFWGNSSLGETLGITRADIKVSFKFEPTCVFMGCVTSDNESQGISRKCIPTEHMGDMDELTTGEGRIEMIRKTPGGGVEEFQIKGTQLINANGVWCYQIPMNLDYITTDEYGNTVPTDDPDKGIPTRARVRFRLSMQDNEENKDNYHRAKVLIPHNPQYVKGSNGFSLEKPDYEFGTYTKDTSYRDLFWNNVYSVKSYIPRIQKKNTRGWKTERFTGIKHCNFYGQNSPIPYNNIRIRLPLMFMILCALIKAFIFLVSLYNKTIKAIFNGLLKIVNAIGGFEKLRAKVVRLATGMRYMVLMDGLCPDLDNWYFAPLGNSDNKYACVTTHDNHKEIYYAGRNSDSYDTDETSAIGIKRFGFHGNQTGDGPFDNSECDDCDDCGYRFSINLLEMTLDKALDDGAVNDEKSIDAGNKDNEEEGTCITTKTDYLIACIEMALAMEYRVINFDFYNDWINGMIYIPRWVRYVKPKSKFLGITWSKEKVRGCMDNPKIFSRTRRYVQQCSIGYTKDVVDGKSIFTNVPSPNFSGEDDPNIRKSNRIHKKSGFRKVGIFGHNGGICHEGTTLRNQNVYYLKPCEEINTNKVNLYATDLILLGSLNDCDENGIPMAFKHLSSTSYLMPTNLALTNMETDGELFGKDGSVVCTGGQSQLNARDAETKGVATVRKTFKDEANAYSGGGFDIEVGNGEQDGYVDTIPLTEAAGISWNYTGPGQGEIQKDKMYYPGGHFLGLSCVNSQSNIKSCINLQRICEGGANMSQRREDVSGMYGNDLEITYSVPTGFISGNDIVDADFRSMFATLNSKRLIATKRNPNTGYMYYDFMFSRPINFDGSFKNVVSDSGSYYNRKIVVTEEDLSGVISGAEIGSVNPDFDPNETQNTQTNTKERTSLYYYMFRFGYTEEDDITNNLYGLQRKKFLLQDDDNSGRLQLPQYENSFYFYFGLNYGSTALDEFNKQFFSQCETMTLQKEPTVIVIPEFDVCRKKGRADVIVNNLQIPYQSVMLSPNVDGVDYTELYHNSTTFSLENLEYGNYELTIIDDNYVTIVKTFGVGTTNVSFDKNIVDFNMNLLSGETVPPLYLYENFIYKGGYVDVFNLYFNDMDISDFEYVKLRIDKVNGIPSDYCEVNVTDFNEHYFLYGKYALQDYDLKILYKCKPIDGESFEEVSINLDRFKFYDNSSIQLRFGNKNNENEDATFNLINGQDGSIRPYMTNMKDEWWWDNTYYSITGDTCDKWVFRPFFFKESKSNNETFDSRVYTKNGRKVLWGSPQNSLVIKRSSGCTEDVLTLVPGYSLDDEYTYIPTYGIISSQSVVENFDNGVLDNNRISGNRDSINYANLQYSAIAYDDNKQKVSGNYLGRYEKASSSITFLSNGENNFKNGYGCAFKPLPYGEVLFMFYDDSNDCQNMLDMISMKRPDAEYGVLYPSFIYPVMRRPFYVSGDIFIWAQDVLKTIENGASLNDIYYDRIENGIKSECGIHNGITVKKNGSTKRFFDSASWFAGLNSTEFSILANTTDNDLHGMTYREPNDRIIRMDYYKALNGLNESDTSVVGFYIKEGCPDNCAYGEYANGISYLFGGGFAKSFYILRDQDDKSKITNIAPTGGDDDDSTIIWQNTTMIRLASGLLSMLTIRK